MPLRSKSTNSRVYSPTHLLLWGSHSQWHLPVLSYDSPGPAPGQLEATHRAQSPPKLFTLSSPKPAQLFTPFLPREDTAKAWSLFPAHSFCLPRVALRGVCAPPGDVTSHRFNASHFPIHWPCHTRIKTKPRVHLNLSSKDSFLTWPLFRCLVSTACLVWCLKCLRPLYFTSGRSLVQYLCYWWEVTALIKNLFSKVYLIILILIFG